jgi:hypothetical protein
MLAASSCSGVLDWRVGADVNLACTPSPAYEADSLSLTDFAPNLLSSERRSLGVNIIWKGGELLVEADCCVVQDGQLPRIFRRGRALRTQAYRREAHFTLHAMKCVVGLITVRVMRERRDHSVCVGRVGSAEYPRSTVAGAPACREL